MDILYKQLDHLPHPPVELVNSLIDQWIEKFGAFTKVSEFPDLKLENVSNPRRNISTYDPIEHEINTWLSENIGSSDRWFSKWTLRMYHRKTISNDGIVYPKHLDAVTKQYHPEQNHYVLIYNLTDSMGDLVYYKEPGKPLIREDRPVFNVPTSGATQNPHALEEFPGAFEVLRRRPPPKTWYLTRIDAIHAVENGNDVPRLALQLRLSEREAIELLKGEQLNYRRLRLPRNPLKAKPDLELFKNYGDQHIKLPEEVLTDEVLDIFKRAGLEPALCLFFCQMNNKTDVDKRVIHYDIRRVDPKPWTPDDDPALKTWQPFICGVNWEINGSIADFGWWDMTNVQERWPVRKGIPIRFDELNSVHYVKRSNFGIPEGAKQIDSVIVDDRPILLRTEIPHQVLYNGENIRMSVSVRFKNDWKTWEEAVAAFSKIME